LDMPIIHSFRFSARFFILTLIMSLCPVFILHGPAWGEPRIKEKLVLSLPQLIHMAIAKSPEIGESRSEIAAARSDLEQVKAAYYPQLESTAVVGPIDDAREPVIRDNKIFDPSPGTSLSNIGIFGRLDFTITQPLYTFGKLANRRKAASDGVRAKEFGLVEKKSRIALRVKQLYYALILAREGIDAADEAGDFFDDARRRIIRLLDLDSPNVSESDLYRIDAFRADSIRSRAEAQKGVEVAYFALKSLIHLPPGKEFDIAEEALPMKDEDLDEMESYIKKAFANRPEFKQLNAALEAQKFQVQAAQSDRYPSFFVALEGSFATAPGRDILDNPYIPDDFNHAYAGVVAGVKWEFDFGIGRAKVDKVSAEYSKLLYTKASAEMNIRIQTVKSYQEVLEWKKAVNAYRKAVSSSRKWVITALADFDMGVGTAENMLVAIEKYGHNQSKYLEALFNYNMSLAKLEFVAGAKDWQEDRKK